MVDSNMKPVTAVKSQNTRKTIRKMCVNSNADELVFHPFFMRIDSTNEFEEKEIVCILKWEWNRERDLDERKIGINRRIESSYGNMKKKEEQGKS